MALLPLRRLAARRESAYGWGRCYHAHRIIARPSLFSIFRAREILSGIFFTSHRSSFSCRLPRARRAKRTYPYPALKERTTGERMSECSNAFIIRMEVTLPRD